jgi:hypothetical protein
MKLLMFAGAGSVGKTSLMNACKEMAESRDLSVTTHFSSTRQSYANAGLTSESDALKDPEFNREFQHTVMDDNIAALRTTLRESLNNRTDLFITDRSPYDYSGYYFSVFPETLDLEMIKTKREKCNDSIMSLLELVKNINIIMLPYPTAWAVDAESSDGWRADKTGKNFIWSNVIDAELAEAKILFGSRPSTRERVEIGRLQTFLERGPCEVRAVGALLQMFPQLR